MEKQHNRGQDGAGVATVKIDQSVGKRFISRHRSIDSKPIEDIFYKINKKIKQAKKENPVDFNNSDWAKENVPFFGEVLLGHLRYGTYGKAGVEYCHPMLRRNNWRSRNLVVAGNFNMTNVDLLFDNLVALGQHPKGKIDTVTVMEKIGHFLDEENQLLFDNYKNQGYSNVEISKLIEENIDIQRILKRSCKDFDGGYAMAGIIGHGSAFVARDPSGIRPAYYYADDEIIVVASEKPAIKTAFNIPFNKIKSITPGHVLIINKKGDFEEKPFIQQREKKSCSFERIYFSRGSDPDIYRERKHLGKLLLPQVLEAIDYDFQNTIFSYIPNTAESAFLGLMESVDEYLAEKRIEAISNPNLSKEELLNIMHLMPRVEKLVIKDAKLRTFITDDAHRDDLVGHVYDTTYEVVKKNIDTLVVIDDSIVRGTTLEKSILTILDKLEPKRIVIVSSAPQIKFPDCYGIDMSVMDKFIAFRAMLELLEETNQKGLIDTVYKLCKKAVEENDNSINHVKKLYEPFSDEQISDKIAEIISRNKIKAEVKVVFQTVDNLHKGCPNDTGDWYFTGNFPTDGGTRVVNKSFINFVEGVKTRAY